MLLPYSLRNETEIYTRKAGRTEKIDVKSDINTKKKSELIGRKK
jgi:hypothetical protein